MTKELKKELLSIIYERESNLYDFICNNCYLMSKDDLKDLAKEAVALLYSYADKIAGMTCTDYDEIKKAEKELEKEYIENIKEYTYLLEEEEAE